MHTLLEPVQVRSINERGIAVWRPATIRGLSYMQPPRYDVMLPDGEIKTNLMPEDIRRAAQ